MSDQCAQKMDDIIEGGMNERDHLYQEIEQYEHDNKVQSERIKSLESSLQVALEYLGYKEGCPGEKQMLQNSETCKNCNDDQDLSICWREYLPLWKKEAE